MSWPVAALAAALAAAFLILLAIRRAHAPPKRLELGAGPPLLILVAPGEPVAPFLKACAPLAAYHRLIALDRVRGRQAERVVAALSEKPLILAHGRGAATALRLAVRARGLLLVAPPRLRLAPADVLFPPVIVLADGRAKLGDLARAPPTLERVSAPKLGAHPELRRPDLFAASFQRLKSLLES